MKNLVRKIVLLIFVFMFFINGIFADDAIVTSVKGKVEVSHGDDKWVSLAVGDKVSESDVVSTGFQSEVRIKYNGSVMLLGALTRVTLNQMSSNAKTDKVDVFLNTGAVRSKVTHTEDRKVSYNVRGPVAVASVRGTDFTCFANGNVQCFEGAVAVYPARSFVEELVFDDNSDGENAEDSESETNSSEDESQTSESDEKSAEIATTDNVMTDNVENTSESNTEGPATATTPAQEISSTAPAGAVVVAQNQETTFTSSGRAAKPLEVSTKNMTKAKNQVTTAASKESVSAGSPAETPTPVETVVKKGSISVTITLED